MLEVEGIDADVVAHFSRRATITARTTELTADYRETHGHEPSRTALLRITQ